MIVKYDCVTCENEDCMDSGSNSVTINCNGYKHRQTNAEKIRAMSDEELAKLLSGEDFYPWCEKEPCPAKCRECILSWLKEEVKHELQKL